jgi:hypothetical protein
MATSTDPRLLRYAIVPIRSEHQQLNHIQGVVDVIDDFTDVILKKLQEWETVVNSRSAA